jgi:hypothetical protein
MINFDKIFKTLSILHGEAQDVVTPVELVRELVGKIPAQEFTDPSRTFFDGACGKGTFFVAVAERCYLGLEKHFPDPNERIKHIVENQLFGVDNDKAQVQTAITTMKKLAGADVKVNIELGDTLVAKTKITKFRKFHNCVGNPPYNISDKKTGNGTGGDVSLYKRFYKEYKALTTSDGNIALITPKGIIPVLDKDNMDVQDLNLMTEKNYWKYNTCYFIAKNIKKSFSTFIVSDKIISKVFELRGNTHWYELNGKPDNRKINVTAPNGVRAIIKLPTEKIKEQYGMVDPEYSKLLGRGPKLCATLLENRHSYIVTDEPLCADFTGAYICKSIEEANKLKLFADNNQVLRGIQKRLKTKGVWWTFRHLKPFDLSQIETGNEVPVEWNLSDSDIAELLK